jgi:type III pantothenate kinase
MLLAVDVGNTQTVFGLFEGEELREHWRIATERHRSGDELGAQYKGFLDLARVCHIRSRPLCPNALNGGVQLDLSRLRSVGVRVVRPRERLPIHFGFRASSRSRALSSAHSPS